MALQSVAVRGKHLFTWEVGAAEAAEIERAAADVARSSNFSVEDAALDAIQSLIEIGPLSGDVGAAQEIAALYYLLSQPTHQPGYPGTFRDYVGEWQFAFDVDLVAGRLHVKVTTERVVHG